MTKTELRKNIKSLLKETFLSDEKYRDSSSEKICSKLLHSDEYRQASVILGYMPLNTEVDVLPILQKALVDGKRVAVPRIIPDTSIMEFYFLQQQEIYNQLQVGSYGIYEPDANLPKFQFNDFKSLSVKEKILILVPGLAFSKNNNRLGRGKGFYDIFMSSFEKEVVQLNPGIDWKKMGICFPCQVLEQIPVAENDVTVDSVIF